MTHHTDVKPIPVMGSAIVNGLPWIQQQIASIDYPVERYILINNGHGEFIHELNDIAQEPHPYIHTANPHGAIYDRKMGSWMALGRSTLAPME